MPIICGREPTATAEERKLGTERSAELSAKVNQVKVGIHILFAVVNVFAQFMYFNFVLEKWLHFIYVQHMDLTFAFNIFNITTVHTEEDKCFVIKSLATKGNGD